MSETKVIITTDAWTGWQRVAQDLNISTDQLLTMLGRCLDLVHEDNVVESVIKDYATLALDVLRDGANNA